MFELLSYVAGLFLHCCSELKRMLVKKQRGKNYAPQLAHKAVHTRFHHFTTGLYRDCLTRWIWLL